MGLMRQGADHGPLFGPPTNGTRTSGLAAESMVPHAGRLREQVLAVIRSASSGLTCDQVEQVTGLTHQTASARVNELARRGAIRRTAMMRPTRSGRRAYVYVAA